MAKQTFYLRGDWSIGEEHEFSRLINALEEGLTGLEGNIYWWPSTFEAYSDEDALRAVIEIVVIQGYLTAGQLLHRVYGHLPVGWFLDKHLIAVTSRDRNDLLNYAKMIGVSEEIGVFEEFDDLEFGENTEVFGAVVTDEATKISLGRGNVVLSLHGVFRCPRPPFGFPEPI